MRTHLGELDHPGSHEDEERLIGHAVGSVVARVYDRGRRLARLRPLAEAWGQRLEAIVSRPRAPVRSCGIPPDDRLLRESARLSGSRPWPGKAPSPATAMTGCVSRSSGSPPQSEFGGTIGLHILRRDSTGSRRSAPSICSGRSSPAVFPAAAGRRTPLSDDQVAGSIDWRAVGQQARHSARRH